MGGMTDTSLRANLETAALSPSPRRSQRPGWLDTRLVLGVALVLGAVLLGATVVSHADQRTPVWAASHDVAAGTVLTAADLSPARVQLGGAARGYVPAREAVVGRAVMRPLTAGELLPRGALTVPEGGITVTIPVRPENAPKLDRGERITVWISAKACRGVVVLSGVPVQDLRQSGGSSFGTSSAMGVVVSISAPDAQRVISALDIEGALVRVGILAAGQPPMAVQDPSVCAVSAR